jgi:hypothetical protein
MEIGLLTSEQQRMEIGLVATDRQMAGLQTWAVGAVVAELPGLVVHKTAVEVDYSRLAAEPIAVEQLEPEAHSMAGGYSQ